MNICTRTRPALRAARRYHILCLQYCSLTNLRLSWSRNLSDFPTKSKDSLGYQKQTQTSNCSIGKMCTNKENTLLKVPTPFVYRGSFVSKCTLATPNVGLHTLVKQIIGDEPQTQVQVERAIKLFCSHYSLLSPEDRRNFLCETASRWGVNVTKLVEEAREIGKLKTTGEGSEETAGQVVRRVEKLRRAITPDYHKLFTQIGKIEAGVKFLVDLRAEVLEAQWNARDETEGASLRNMSGSLKELLGLWISVGMLSLERLTWHSPASLIQAISDSEAVHPIRSWHDVKQRVGPYRRCYVFTHSAMPLEPLVVLHTALVPDIPSDIQTIVSRNRRLSEEVMEEEEDFTDVRAAIFYSITNTQQGLQGVDLGNLLIKRVVGELQREAPAISVFSSLSPIPGFTDWLLTKISLILHSQEPESHEPLLTSPEVEILKEALHLPADSDLASVLTAFKEALLKRRWHIEQSLLEAFKGPLTRLCARYLYLEKHRGYALNSVANFHLRNGAVMWRINWQGDTSPRGLEQSCGLMVNYRYYLDKTAQYSGQYLTTQVIQVDPQVTALLPHSSRL